MRDANGFTLLHKAVLLDDIDIAQRIISLGAFVASPSPKSMTPFHMVTHTRNIKMVDLLLSQLVGQIKKK